jgi:thiamine-triphosphatase
MSGTYIRSTFSEITNPIIILAQIQHYLSHTRIEKEKFSGLDILVQLVTTREVYVADEQFTVVLDRTDFGHSVGEVELEAADAEKAHGDIDKFLKRYAWFCEMGAVEGKLKAYFRLQGGEKKGGEMRG